METFFGFCFSKTHTVYWLIKGFFWYFFPRIRSTTLPMEWREVSFYLCNTMIPQKWTKSDKNCRSFCRPLMFIAHLIAELFFFPKASSPLYPPRKNNKLDDRRTRGQSCGAGSSANVECQGPAWRLLTDAKQKHRGVERRQGGEGWDGMGGGSE